MKPTDVTILFVYCWVSTCFGPTGPSSGDFVQLFTQPLVQYLSVLDACSVCCHQLVFIPYVEKMHGTKSLKTATCFDTRVPSPGSLLNQRNTSHARPVPSRGLLQNATLVPKCVGFGTHRELNLMSGTSLRVDRDSSVGIATGYGLDGPGFESR